MSIQQDCRIDLDSGYVIQGIFSEGGPGAHRIQLTYSGQQPDPGSEMMLDPNVCQLDPFGDTAGCTRIAVRHLDVVLELLQEQNQRQLFAINARDYQGPPLRLVLLRDATQGGLRSARLLVLGEGDRIEKMLQLAMHS